MFFCNATGLLLLFKIELLAMMFIIIYVGAIAVLFLFVVMMLNLKVQGNEENSALAQSDQVPVGPSWYNLSSQKQANSSPARKTWVATGIGGTTWFLVASASACIIFLRLRRDASLEANPTGLDLVQAKINANDRVTQEAAEKLASKQLNILWNASTTHQETLASQKPWIMLIDSITNAQSLGHLTYTYNFFYFMMAGLILLIAMIGAIVLTMYKTRQAAKKQIIYQQVTRTFEKGLAYTG